MAAERMAKSVIAVAAVLVLAGCMSTHTPALVEASSQDLSLPEHGSADAGTAGNSEPAIFSKPDTSFSNRQQLGDEFAQQILARSKRSPDEKLQAKLQTMVSNIGRHVDGNRFEYRVYLLDDPRPNAFTTGGGHVFITAGLVAALRTEGQIAAVIAHEMAHNASAHVVKGAHSRKIVKETATFSENVMHQRWGLPWLGSSIEFLVSTGANKYTREQEDEADFLGLQYIVAAGYDPHEAPRAVMALVADGGDQSELENFFFGRHSTAKARVWRFKNLIKAYYPNLDTQGMKRSSADYDELAMPYWKAASSGTVATQ
ncbi:MAG: M48 family metalloprotease [Rhizobiales bacterium]|nr:M48 family metalloprotease [Hyphomicrobiales bacterium]